MNNIESLVSALKHGEMGMKELLSQIENLNVSQISSSYQETISPEITLPNVEGSIRKSRESISNREEIEILQNSQHRLFISQEDIMDEEDYE